MQTRISDHTCKSHAYTQTYKVYDDTHSLSKMFTQDVLRRENQCLLAFTALHSHSLETVVFFA